MFRFFLKICILFFGVFFFFGDSVCFSLMTYDPIIEGNNSGRGNHLVALSRGSIFFRFDSRTDPISKPYVSIYLNLEL